MVGGWFVCKILLEGAVVVGDKDGWFSRWVGWLGWWLIDLAKVRPVVYIKYFIRNILSYELYSTTAYLSFFKKKEKKTKCRRNKSKAHFFQIFW